MPIPRAIPLLILLAAAPAAAVLSAPRPAVAPARPLFEREIQPILKARCFECHGEQKQAGLDLRQVRTMLAGGSRGPALVPGKPEKSPLLLRVENGTMPPGPGKRLPPSEVKLLREWVAAGAPLALPEPDPAGHWAWTPPRRPAVPTPKARAWVQTPVDAFVAARLERHGISPPPAADRRTLLRRATLDLWGIPPTPAEVEAFVQDRSPEAWARVVDRLLASPNYGVRWARHWLDVARYAESNGYERDGAKPSAWRYRDWVAASLNRDKPFDRFLVEQLAGDELPGSGAEQQIAATFLRLGTWDDEPAEPMVDRYDQLDDVLGTTATAFMGVTLRCARCHDHKFEPFSQKDYYGLLAVFNPLKRPQEGRTDLDRHVGTASELSVWRDNKERIDRAVAVLDRRREAILELLWSRVIANGTVTLPDPVRAAFQVEPERRSDEQKKLVRENREKLEPHLEGVTAPAEREQLARIAKDRSELEAARIPEPPRAYVWYEEGPDAPPTRLLHRGDPTQPREEVSPALPAVLVRTPPEGPRPLASTTGRRLWLANWLASAENPLTSRVFVNRVWSWHFGEGIVATENDFGRIGQRPWDPALLDWLARWFTDQGPDGGQWSVKRLHRLLMLSNTYKASAAWRPEAAARDPLGVLPWRWRPRRLEAEAVRDSILAVTGKLNPEMGGPSVYPEIPRAVLEGQSRPGDGWGKSDERQASRRSLYIFSKRSLAVPELETLDAPDTTSSCEQRPVSTIAPQALTFLNGDWINGQARAFAARLRAKCGEDEASQIRLAFALTVCRPPGAGELAACREFLARQPRKETALESLCLVLLNANEFWYLG